MDHFEKFENKLISSYESILAAEGREICKKIDSILEDDDELLVEKAKAYCHFCTDPKRVNIDEKLFERCKKYLDGIRNYRDIKYILKNISRRRKMV